MTPEELLAKADKAYFEDDESIITDYEYDKLRQEVGETGYVQGSVSPDLGTYEHPFPVLSLDKIYETDKDVEKKIAKWLGTIAQPKLDGLTIINYPNPDGSCSFVTRGYKGLIGEVLPNFIPEYEHQGVNLLGAPVRGEVVLSFQAFQDIVDDQVNRGEQPFTSPRNAAAAILRRKDRSPYIDRLTYIVYDIMGNDLSYQDKIKLLKKNTSFPVIKSVIVNSLEDIKNLLTKLRDNKVYPVDGVVLKNPEALSLTKLGQTAHHPNNAIAYKSEDESYSTRLLRVEWQAGRTKLTPVAILDPVLIDDVTVYRATLHNLGFIQRMGIREGDIISICRSGQVIPKVLGVVNHLGGPEITAPEQCPSCGTKLITTENIVNGTTIKELRCTNPSCRAKLIKNIEFLASKTVLDIEGLSEVTAAKIVEKYATEGDTELMIFSLTEEELRKLPGFAEQSAKKLYQSIQKVKDTPLTLSKMIQAVCFPGIGKSVGDILASKFKTADDVLLATQNFDFTTLGGIGEDTNKLLKSRNFYEKLSDVNDTFKLQETVTPVSGGRTWVITGTLPVVRSEIVGKLIAIGDKVANSVTKNTDFLLIDNVNSRTKKANDARRYGTKLVNYKFFEEEVRKHGGLGNTRNSSEG